MKKILTVLVALLLSINLHAQSEEHFEFMGIPMTGNSKSFSEKLQEKGFEVVTDNDGTPFHSTLKGLFAGEKSTIMLLDTPISNTIYTVVVSFEDSSTWASLQSKFNKAVDQYTIKYGKPDGVIKKFDYPYDEGDGHEMTAVAMDKVRYVANWKLDKGKIFIIISKYKDVTIYYSDYIGDKLSEREKSNVIQNDI